MLHISRLSEFLISHLQFINSCISSDKEVFIKEGKYMIHNFFTISLLLIFVCLLLHSSPWERLTTLSLDRCSQPCSMLL